MKQPALYIKFLIIAKLSNMLFITFSLLFYTLTIKRISYLLYIAMLRYINIFYLGLLCSFVASHTSNINYIFRNTDKVNLSFHVKFSHFHYRLVFALHFISQHYEISADINDSFHNHYESRFNPIFSIF